MKGIVYRIRSGILEAVSNRDDRAIHSLLTNLSREEVLALVADAAQLVGFASAQIHKLNEQEHRSDRTTETPQSGDRDREDPKG